MRVANPFDVDGATKSRTWGTQQTSRWNQAAGTKSSWIRFPGILKWDGIRKLARRMRIYTATPFYIHFPPRISNSIWWSCAVEERRFGWRERTKRKKKNRRWRIRCSWNCALRWRGVHLLLRLLLIILWLPKKGRDAARTPATCVWYNTWRTTLNVFFPLFLLLLPSPSTLLWNNNTFEHQKKRHHATAVSLFTLKKKKELLLLLMNGSIFWRVMASQVTATNGRRSSPGCADCFLFLSKVQMKTNSLKIFFFFVPTKFG